MTPNSTPPRPPKPPFILASASPRRVALLDQLGLSPDCIIPADIDETPLPTELPRQHAARLAESKARTIAEENGGAIVLGADTVVARGRRIFPKAEDEKTARTCLALLSGEKHRVYGGVCIITPGGGVIQRLVMTAISFKRLSHLETERYIESGEWRGKAGGYAIQGRAAEFVQRLNGSYSNVVGLPLFETAQVLRGVGYSW
jgi:septum formation protein